MATTVKGPNFQIESDKAIVGLGHSERKHVGEFLARTIDELGIFRKIEIVTLNKSAGMIGRKALRRELESSFVIGHSAFITRVQRALQVVAINPPEPVSLINLAKRTKAVIDDPIRKEHGAHKTGIADMIGAGFELARSPLSSARTPIMISRGYSTIEQLVARANDFPAGRAVVHSALDSFGFADLADMDYASNNGVTTVVLPNHYHNEALFAPNRLVSLLTPAIFPHITEV